LKTMGKKVLNFTQRIEIKPNGNLNGHLTTIQLIN
jgi:hypothetical protein